jgi:WD40 repeat protein
VRFFVFSCVFFFEKKMKRHFGWKVNETENDTRRENATMHARRRRGSSSTGTGSTTTTTKENGDAGVMMEPRRLRQCDDDADDDGRRIDFVCHASRVIDADSHDVGVGFDADVEETTNGTTEAMSAMMMLRLERDAAAVCGTGGDARGETTRTRVDRVKTRERDAYASDTAMLDHALRTEDSVVEACNDAYEMRVKERRAMRAVALDVGVQTAEASRRDAATLTGGSSARSVGAQADELDDSAREDEADFGGKTKGVSALRVATGWRRSDSDGVSALGVVEAVLRERERAEYGLKYRGVRPVDKDEHDDRDDDGENALTRLATLRSETLVGLNISALQFNPKRKDLLCVAYGEFNFNRAVSEEFNRGALAFWSLQSDAPLRIVRLESGVLSIDWSTTHPNLLVVGCYDGEVLVFDLDNSSSIRRRRVHHDPVWAVKWFDHVSSARDADTDARMTVESAPRLCDTFLSASTDGLVTAWELRDDLQSKRAFSLRWSPPGQPSRGDASAVRDVQTSEELVRRGGITCVDVSKSAASDSKSYLIGTEEGKIYECSLARSDQWMTAYEPHIAPAYSLKINPHCPNVFATCSADWSVKIFHDEKLSGGGASSGSSAASSIAIDGASSAAAVSASNLKESLVLPEYVLERGCEPINDLDWCPWRSTELAIVTDDGALEIWDLASSTVVPLYEFRVGGKENTAAVSVSYSRETPTVVVVGLANGTATVLRTRWRRVTDTVPTAEKQRERIESLCRRRTQHTSSS